MRCWVSSKQHQKMMRKREIELLFQSLQSLIPVVEQKAHTSRKEIDELARLIKTIYQYFPNEMVDDWEIYMISHLLFTSRIKIPDYIYVKKDKISPLEVLAIHEHITFADEFMSQSPIFNRVKEAFYAHHERYDGHGYPGKNKGNRIPFFARVIHVAESFISMSTPRSYRDTFTPMEALIELHRERGTIYDPKVVDALEKVLGFGQLNIYPKDYEQQVEKESS